ncbi:MAG: hypothetical protein PVG91_00905 [Gammaproteobacteria bacterium]|jgi:hypothetical protein
MSNKAASLKIFWLSLLLGSGALAQEPQTVTSPDELPPPATNPAELLPEPMVQPAPEPPPLSVTVRGVSETRFNPTYGSVFFVVSGGDLADAGRDARITADGRTLPSTRTSVSPRIVAGRYRLAPGPRQLTMTGWDAQGRPLETGARIWTGELPLLVVVTDFAGSPVRQARVTVSLDQQRRVAEERPVRDGMARFANLPDERLLVEVDAADGTQESRVVPAAQGVVEFRLRP